MDEPCWVATERINPTVTSTSLRNKSDAAENEGALSAARIRVRSFDMPGLKSLNKKGYHPKGAAV